MDWKDTLIDYDEMVKVTGYHSFTPKEGREAQAEISFKAGIQEVVEWIKGVNKSGDFYYSFDQAELEAKLKEWGVK